MKISNFLLLISNGEEYDLYKRRIFMYYGTKVATKKWKGHYLIEDKIINFTDRSIRIRIYKPKKEYSIGTILFFHGGGYVIGNVETHDNICRAISIKTNLTLISVDYRLAPEYKFPAQIQDSYDTLNWVIKNSERLNTSSNNIFLIGDSAGGNLCAVTCIKARNSGIKNIKGQILIYPLTNLADLNTESYKLYDKGYLLSKKEIEWFRQNYIPNPDIWSSPDASPLLEKDLSNLPSALIITAQFDILHDEGVQYAEKLKKFGNVVEHIDIKGVTHGFMSMDRFLPQTNLVYNKIQEFIFRILNTNQS